MKAKRIRFRISTSLMAICLLAGCNESESSRVVLNFNTGWKWIDADITGGEDPALDESGAQNVSLPHSTVINDLFDVNPEEWRKVTWYRRHFSLPEKYAGMRVNVLFQGAGQVNTVYVNGQRVGEAKGYFTPFDFDIEKFIKFGGADNVIAVRVDSREHPEMPPTGGDFHYFGGIHRDVIMTITDPVRVEDVFVWTEPAKKGVQVKARVKVVNGSDRSQALELLTVLQDMKGKKVSAAGTKAVTVKAGASHLFKLTHTINVPHLWTPDDPFLHRFISILRADGEQVDEHIVTTGLRWVSADPHNKNRGRIYLNGKEIRLFGANRHEQYPYIGNAAPNRFHRRDAHLLKYGAGCNVVRTSHYTNDPDFIDECDRIGLLVVSENLGWQTIGNDAWKAVYENSLTSMVRRYRNHPSIIIWSVMVNEGPANELEWERKLNAMVKRLDPSRLTADHTNKDKAEFITDLWHRHDYTPGGNIIKVKYQPCVIGEFNNRLGSNFVIPNDNESRKLRMLLQDGIKANKLWGNPKIAGIMRWDAFGYLTPNNVEPYGQCNYHKNFAEYRNSGIFGCYRQPRYLAYWWQSQADPEQVGDTVHILSEWKSDSASTVYVASNADEVELLRNEQSFGKIRPNLYTRMKKGLFCWDGVEWKPGSKLTARAYRDGKKVAEAVRYATDYDNEAKLVIVSRTGNSITADGSDMAWIEARILDGNGQVSDYADANLSIALFDGPGVLIHKTRPIQLPDPPPGSGLDVIQMTDGYGVFYVRSKFGQAGSVKVAVKADVGVSVDDSEKGGAARIYYYGPWKTEKRPEAYGGSVHMIQSERKQDCYIEIKFSGTQIRIYGGRAFNFGRAAISIDGGRKRIIDCCTLADRERENMLLFTSPMLTAGEHTVMIRPELRKQPVSKNKWKKTVGPRQSFGFSLDRVKIMDGRADLESEPIIITALPMIDAQVPNGLK